MALKVVSSMQYHYWLNAYAVKNPKRAATLKGQISITQRTQSNGAVLIITLKQPFIQEKRVIK